MASSGPPQKFESLSPGDVESISSEGEIPEAEVELEGDSHTLVKPDTSELIIADKNAGEVTGILDEAVMTIEGTFKLDQAEDEIAATRPESVERKAPSTPPSLPNLVPAMNSPIKVSVVSSPTNLIHIPPSTTPPTAVSSVPTPVGSPIPPDEPSMDLEQFEPILSDEDIVEETDPQYMDFDIEYIEDHPSKTFSPFACELQSLIYLTDPSLSLCEVEAKRLLGLRSEPCLRSTVDIPIEATKLEEIVLQQEKLPSNNADDTCSGDAQVHEDWVHLAEQIPPLLVKALPYVSNKDDVLQAIFKWVEIGMDFNLALSQPQPGYKVRHIKAGVRLVDALCHCGESITEQLLQAQDIHSKLLDLYHKDYMALSIKLMILRALDSSLNCQQAIQYFLGYRTRDSKNNIVKVKKIDFDASGYRTLIKMIQGNQLARVKFAISCLLRKLHAYEVLEKLKESVGQLIDASPPPGSASPEEERRRQPDASPETITAEVSDQEVETIVSCLEEILRVYREAPLAISQPKRFLPVCSQFEISPCSQDPYRALYVFFRSHRLLEVCLVLLSCPATAGYSAITVPVQEILAALLDSQGGMQFLASHAHITNAILRIVLQQAPPVSPGPPEDVLDEGAVSPPPAQQLGLYMAYRLQALHYIDMLLYLGSSDPTYSDPDQTEVLENLNSLYCLGFSPVGKLSLVHVLSRGNNIRVLLRFFTSVSLRDQSQSQTLKYDISESKLKKSPGKNYAADLIVMTVKYSDYVPFLQNFGKEILNAAVKDEHQSPSCRLFDIVPWLKPVENPSAFAYDDIGMLSEIIKRNVDNATNLPGELITAVRILKYLGVPIRDKDLNAVHETVYAEEYVELKYKYVILQLFSQEGVSNLTSILQKLCEYYEQPMLHSTSFVGYQGAMLVALILPAIQLVRRMLTYVIHCRNTEFKDLSAVPVLLQTYTLMHAFPASALSYIDSQRVCREIVETLLAYTQPISSSPSSETEALNKSLWTMMMSEVVKYVTTGPHTFVPGLLVLSELLPLPLPVQTRMPLPEDEVLRAVNGRKLWSAHLHSLGAGLQELIATMSGSSFQPLLQLLRRVCVQLADLAAPTALIVSRGVLDTVLASLQNVPSTSQQPNNSLPTPIPNPEFPCSGHTARLLNFLACLVTHASVKSAVLHLLARGGSIKSDERYPGLVTSLCAILCSPSDSPSHIQAQECVVSVIQSLCDTVVTLLPPPGTTLIAGGGAGDAGSMPTPDVYLANALPPRDLLITMCTIMLEHIANIEHSFTTLLPTVRTFLMLTEHDYGFYHLKSCLEKKTDALLNLFVKFCSGFSKDSSDCLSTLSTSLELLRVCISLEEDDAESGLGLPPRSLVMSVPELAAVLGWSCANTEGQEEESADSVMETDMNESGDTKESADTNSAIRNKKKHPLFCLEKLLQECSNEDEALESLHENVASLIRLLEIEGYKPIENRDSSEPVLPAPEPLLSQFAARPVFVVGEVDDERLSSTYWLAPPPVDEADQDMDQVNCDLLEMARLYLPDFHMHGEVERVCRLKAPAGTGGDDDEADHLKKRGDDLNKYLAAESKNKRPFIAPMRGRGFGRSVPQRGDLFRSRPPNTSRPPSLHVDDFVALEISGQQPTGPTGYNKISMRAAKDMMATRSRGRGRAFGTERGRFFGSASPYNRRENGRGIPRGISTMPPRVGNGRGGVSPVWPPHGSEVPSPSSQPPPPLPRSFRTPESREMRMIPHSDEKFNIVNSGGRFGGRGVRGGGPGNWVVKDNRERFGGPPIRGGGRREPPPGRHIRSFTR